MTEGRSLLLLRHAKSDWSAGYLGDAERALNRRGRKAAKIAGCFLAAADLRPDHALTSPARRARHTLDLAQQAGGWTCPVTVSDWLYDGGPADAVRLIPTAVPPSARTVLAVGHEPTWSAVVEILTGAFVRFPTAALCHIELDVPTWEAMAAGTGRMQLLVTPRTLEKVGCGT